MKCPPLEQLQGINKLVMKLSDMGVTLSPASLSLVFFKSV